MKVDNNAPHSVSNSLSSKVEDDLEDYSVELIKVDTIDNFVKSNSSGRINYLKIDTEGYDLHVLKGGKRLLKAQDIDFIQVEVSMNPFNTFHVNYLEVVNYLENLGYYIFGIYNQIHDFKLEKPVLRRCDFLFVSSNILEL